MWLSDGTAITIAYPNGVYSVRSSLVFTQRRVRHEVQGFGSEADLSTFLGGTNDDVLYGLALGAAGHIYVVGTTFSDDFPVHLAIQRRYAGNNDPLGEGGLEGGDAFVTGLTRAGRWMYSTFLGGSATDVAYYVSVHDGTAYVSGMTDSSNFPDLPMPAQPGGQRQFVTQIAWR